ncbi:endonuclease/exonuclease/phosphatase family protein [Fodinicola acaciae]|uniref:endonuclease/exonuclease/phosphatase family protein n=1 Tax=Fodinicola acaciae TaxID=2681555 RepID=UPI001C9E33AA|nr:endonuclease/exonuclease/phosphatase family protein [Fodinicola acaciae]
MKRAAVFLLSLLIVVGLAPASASAHGFSVPLRVLSYNIHAGAGEDNVYDLSRTAAAIASTHADVVGLQEVDVHWGARSNWDDTATALGRRLHMFVRFAPIYSLDPPAAGQPRREFGVAILSRYPIVSFTNHELTRLSTQEPNPTPKPAPGFGEAVIATPGTLVHAYVTHLDYRSDPAVRRMQVADTLKILAEDRKNARQLLIGDFNAAPTAPEIAPLWTRLTDTYGTAAGFTYPAGTPTIRIDYVAASAGITARHAVVPDSFLATTASDHRPMLADLSVPVGGL